MSCCVVLVNTERSLFVVPKASVWADDDDAIRMMEGAANDSKEKRVALLRYLHVSSSWAFSEPVRNKMPLGLG